MSLPTDCFDVATDDQVVQAVHAALGGRTRYIRNVAIPKIGRIARVTCSYGYLAITPTVPVEVSVTQYDNALAAQTRVGVTIKAERIAGAGFRDVRVGTADATILTGKSGSLLVYAQDKLTVAVTISSGAGIRDVNGSLMALASTVQKNLATPPS